MFKKIAEKAQELKDKTDVSAALTATKHLATDSIDAGKVKANALLEETWPTIETTIVKGLLAVTEEKLKDDKTLELLLDKTHELLPIPVRLVVPRAAFIEFSMKRRDPLLIKLQEHRAKKALSAPSKKH